MTGKDYIDGGTEDNGNDTIISEGDDTIYGAGDDRINLEGVLTLGTIIRCGSGIYGRSELRRIDIRRHHQR